MKKIILTLSFLAFLGLSTTYAQVKVGDNPTSIDASAALEVESSAKGFLPPRLTSAQRDAIPSPSAGLMIFNSTENQLEFFDGNRWINITSGFIASGACIGQEASFTFEGLEYKPVESDGKCWLDRNLGASRVATASNDAQSYGDLYQWGRAADGHQARSLTCPTDCYNAALSTDGVANFNNNTSNAWHGKFILRDLSNPNINNWVNPSVLGVDDLWQGVNGTNNPCPAGYRLPTEPEWDAERNSWSSSNNADGAFASPLKLPMTGFRQRHDGSLFDVGLGGHYWSSAVSTSFARSLHFFSTDAYMNTFFRADGLSVRCIKD